jgi:SNF2 family DNA or RNA helicase
MSITDEQQDIAKQLISMVKGGLALPMGSGKTIISLYVCKTLYEKSNKKCIAVVPKSLIEGWATEIKKFYGSTYKYEILHPEYVKNIKDWVPRNDTILVITTPQTIAKSYSQNNIETLYVEKDNLNDNISLTNIYIQPTKPFSSINKGISYIHSVVWECLIIDEIHKLSNIETMKCKGISSIATNYRFGLSGTMFNEPAPTKILGWVCMLDINIPELKIRTVPDMTALLSTRMKSKFSGFSKFVVKKELDMIKDKLPEYRETTVEHELFPHELRIQEMMIKVLESLDKKTKELKALGSTNYRRFRALILVMITYFRQALICPIIPISSVMIEVANLEHKTELANVFNTTLQTGYADLYDKMDDCSIIYSSRIQSVLHVLDKEHDKKIIIFSTFGMCLNVVKHCVLERFGAARNIYSLTSDMSSMKRKKVIEKSGSEKGNILFTTYEIAAEGLNLQDFNTVLLLDFWWNDSKTKQAIKRVYRPGQQSEYVHIYFFNSGTGLENAMFTKQYEKHMILLDLETGTTNKKITSMKNSELLSCIFMDKNKKLIQDIYKRK